MTSQAVKDLVAELNKTLGADVVTVASDPDFALRLLPTGVLPIDHILGGGLPRGRWVEVFGNYSTLKSYLAYRAIATTQAGGGTAALVDTEHSWDAEWGAKLGVDPDQLILLQPETAEEAVDATELLVRLKVDLIVWDSIAAMNPQTEANKRESGENHSPARLAALMSRALRKVTSANRSTAVLAINQTRINVGQTFGNPETTPGGKSMGFYASHRLALRQAGKVTEETVVHDGKKLIPVKRTVAFRVKATLEKSKLTAPFTESWFQFDLRSGQVDEEQWLVAQGIEMGEIKQGKGSWVEIAGPFPKKCNGMGRAADYVRSSPETRDWLLKEVLG